MYGLPAPAAPLLTLTLSRDIHGGAGVVALAAAWECEEMPVLCRKEGKRKRYLPILAHGYHWTRFLVCSLISSAEWEQRPDPIHGCINTSIPPVCGSHGVSSKRMAEGRDECTEARRMKILAPIFPVCFGKAFGEAATPGGK